MTIKQIKDNNDKDDDLFNPSLELSAAKRTLLEKWKRGDALAPAQRRQRIPRRPEDVSISLSFAQQRLWFLDQFEPYSPLYNIPRAVRLTGKLNESALQHTVNEIVGRHEALRTTFAAADGIPRQVIAERIDVSLNIIDLWELPIAEREVRAQELAQAEAETPFDLSTGPLIRVSLLRLGATDQIVLFTLHHIVSDGWSTGVLVNEVAALYTAYVTNQPSPLSELPIQYADFAHWQRQWLSGDVLQEQLDYWTEQLRGSPTLLTLPTDHPRPVIQSHRGAMHSFGISPEATTGLHALNKQTQTTLFMSLLAAFNVLLSRYSGQSDICIGTPIANRNRAEIEGLIGFFANTLVLRTRIDSTSSFESLLQQVRTTTLNAYVHQDVPFEQLVNVLNLERHTSHSPLFQVMLVLQNAPMDSLELPGLTMQAVTTDSITAKFDLLLTITEADGRLLASLEYNTDLFERATIVRMAEHFTRLLEGIVTKPNMRVQDLPMLSAEELHQILVEWNATETVYPRERCIHELFEAQVEKVPDAVAMVFEDQQLTYAQLNARANQLAHYLQELGVGPDVLVGICVERSLEMIVGLLGILKAGGAYVPLDPKYPQERLAYMLADARPAVLLTQQSLQDNLPQQPANVVCLDQDWCNNSPENTSNCLSGVRGENPAYVIYTSGSTGRPKGVVMYHQALVNLLNWQLLNSTIAKPKTLQFTALSFDVSCQEIFSTWNAGGTLILISETLRRDSFSILDFIIDQTVQRIFLPFVALQNLAEVAQDAMRTSSNLHEIITAGETLRITTPIAKWLDKLEGCTLYNQYGPSETHVVTAFTLNGQSETWNVFPPIGQPIANTQIYLLDAHLKPVPIGVSGELYIGGIGLARGYLNGAELTAEKFIPNPFSSEPGMRLYHTGDLARWLPDGNIEFLGRIDYQVKIRGFRIELGEIEAALAALPEVRDVVVVAREDTPGDKRLVAYLVTQAGQSLPETSTIRSKLAQSLPEYMLPAHFLQLEQLPLTPSGKIDRRVLPAPDTTRSEIGYVPPRTPIEESLAQIWAEVLRLDKVSIHDNFFELGGHSLLATQVISRMRAAFQIELPLRDLFEANTLAELAQSVEIAQHLQTPSDVIEENQEEGEL